MNQKYSHTSGVPLSLAVFLATDNYDHNDDPLTISATSIIKPLRQLVLAARVPPEAGVVDISSMLPSRIGTAVHEGIERAWLNNYQGAMEALGIPKKVIQLVRINPTADEVKQNPDIIPVYMEQRLSKKVGKWTVSGKFDFVGQGRLEDFKNTTSYVVQKHINDEKFAWQGSIYRWMGPDIITNDNMAIQFIITDWKAAMAKQDASYPQERLIERIIPLKPVSEVQSFVERKLALLEQYWDVPEDQIPECEEDDLQRTEPLFKYYADPAKAELGGRSTKNFDDKQAAQLHLSSAGKGAIKEVPGQVKACHFCKAFPVCTQKDTLIRAGHLIL
jgi:hypothetical protein